MSSSSSSSSSSSGSSSTSSDGSTSSSPSSSSSRSSSSSNSSASMVKDSAKVNKPKQPKQDESGCISSSASSSSESSSSASSSSSSTTSSSGSSSSSSSDSTSKVSAKDKKREQPNHNVIDVDAYDDSKNKTNKIPELIVLDSTEEETEVALEMDGDEEPNEGNVKSLKHKLAQAPQNLAKSRRNKNDAKSTLAEDKNDAVEKKIKHKNKTTKLEKTVPIKQEKIEPTVRLKQLNKKKKKKSAMTNAERKTTHKHDAKQVASNGKNNVVAQSNQAKKKTMVDLTATGNTDNKIGNSKLETNHNNPKKRKSDQSDQINQKEKKSKTTATRAAIPQPVAKVAAAAAAAAAAVNDEQVDEASKYDVIPNFFAEADDPGHPWTLGFLKVCKWVGENGDTCSISAMRKSGHESLANFGHQQRRAHKRFLKTKKLGHTDKLLTKHRIYRLEAVGFTWGEHFRKPITWDQRIQQIKQYKQKHGSCLVVTPIPNDATSIELANWVAFIQYEYARANVMRWDSVLTFHQMCQLKELGLFADDEEKKIEATKK